MKLFTLLILISLATASAKTSYSQQTKFTLNLEHATVKQLFDKIEGSSEFIFVYYDNIIDLNKEVSVTANNETVEEILEKIFKSSDNTFKVFDRQIVIAKKENSENEAKASPIQQPQKVEISGTVKDNDGISMPGVSVVAKGTTIGTITDTNGQFKLSISPDVTTLIFSFIGMKTQEIPLVGKISFKVILEEEIIGVDEVVVVGYGTQKRSDITGTVASLPKERLEMAANVNIAQAIQGAIPGVMIQTTRAGAAPSESMMIRGRNSILASNEPLIVIDGIPYGGQLNDLNPNDVKSIEVLKDASAAAIYGSRGANGVILITTKLGIEGKPSISYDGTYSIQTFAKLPDVMNGKEFYNFKMTRLPSAMTQSEQNVYDSGKWVNWMDLGLRSGKSQQHSLAISGGFNKTTYYITGNFLDVKGLAVKDNFKRITNRVNVDTKIANWLTIGTRTQISLDDMSGVSPTMGDLFFTNPLATAYDGDGKLTINPILDDPVRGNPLETTLYKNIDKSYQVISNNFAIIEIPFIKGLSNRINSGFRMKFSDTGTYKGRDTKTGLDAGGTANTDRSNYFNTVLENILSYNREFGSHTIFATALLSYEGNKSSSNSMSASGFPHDFLSWYSSSQAKLVTPGYALNETTLISQMLRLNYSYASKYLLTLTSRRDGYSGFGAKNKWGFFPSVALGWNLKEENFFPFKDLFSEMKLRFSYGLNGNQAVGAYESISRLREENMVSLNNSLPGYIPSKLGSDNLGWESSRTINIGLDFGMLKNRLTSTINLFKTNTSDLLLNRTISPIHGITSITQNIGETENNGLEVSFASRNIVTKNFKWTTNGNISFVQNKILSLYGNLDSEGKEKDDVANNWFIGKPIMVNYGYVFDGVWQLNEAAEAAKWGSKPGYIKIKDNGDGKLDASDRQIIGQQDPKFIWGCNNSLSYKNFTVDIFILGVNGVTRGNSLMSDSGVSSGVRLNTINKNWWTPTNPSNEYYMNQENADRMAGIGASIYEDASYIRIKDISLSYDVPKKILDRIGFSKLKLFVSGRNLFTITDWRGLDPELVESSTIPLQKEINIGLNLGF